MVSHSLARRRAANLCPFPGVPEPSDPHRIRSPDTGTGRRAPIYANYVPQFPVRPRMGDWTLQIDRIAPSRPPGRWSAW